MWKAYWRNMPLLLVILAAKVYVHAVCLNPIQVDNNSLLAFGVISTLIKLASQEVAKCYVFRSNVRHIRKMFLVVGLPTVLIDTQVRIVLLRGQNLQVTVSGMLLMALIEITLRIGKTMMLRYELKRHNAGAQPKDGATAKVNSRQLRRMHSGLLTDQRVGFHVAEIFADMYAEYIAIGCCSSILYFYWDHPKYRLSALIDANMTTTTSHGSNNGSVANVNDGAELKRLLMLLAWQVSLELVVDFTSCVLEEVGGISFQDFQKYKLFAALVFGSLAVININMSSILYIRPEN